MKKFAAGLLFGVIITWAASCADEQTELNNKKEFAQEIIDSAVAVKGRDGLCYKVYSGGSVMSFTIIPCKGEASNAR